MFKSIFLCFTSIAIVQAHMQLMSPPGINSIYDPQTLEANKDYSMTQPLNADGSNYPCKGYNTPAIMGPLKSVATLQAGTRFPVKMVGSAIHGGGSCQFALSYDGGASFAVVTSIIGGCMLNGPDLFIDVPADVPAGKKAILLWNWFNEIGNRESYQNCAIVDVTTTKASTTWTAPALYRGNTLPDGTCITTPNQDFVYPNPGPNVQYGGNRNAQSPATISSPCSFDQSKMVTFSSGGGSSSASAPVTPAPAPVAPAPIVKSSTPVVVSTPAAVSRSPVASASSSSSAAPKSRQSVVSVKLVPSASSTSANAAKSPVKSAATAYTPIKSVVAPAVTSTKPSAPTTLAPLPTPTPSSAPAPAPVAPAPVAPAPAAPAPAQAQQQGSYLKCTSPTTFSLCDSTKCYPMGNVAAGTNCVNGAIVMAPSTKRVKRSALASGRRNKKRHVGMEH